MDCDVETFSGPGVEEVVCIRTGVGPGVVDLSFAVVFLVQIIELNRDRETVNQQQNVSTFFDGDKITFTSLLDSATNLSVANLPVGIQMNLMGANALDQTVRQTWNVEFTSDCTVFPVVTTDAQITSTNVVSAYDHDTFDGT